MSALSCEGVCGMAYMEHAVEPREDLLGHLRHCAACWRYGRLQHKGQGGDEVANACNTTDRVKSDNRVDTCFFEPPTDSKSEVMVMMQQLKRRDIWRGGPTTDTDVPHDCQPPCFDLYHRYQEYKIILAALCCIIIHSSALYYSSVTSRKCLLLSYLTLLSDTATKPRQTSYI